MPDSAFCISSGSENGAIKSYSRYDEFKMRILEGSLRVLSRNRRIFATTASLNSKMLQLILFRRVIQNLHKIKISEDLYKHIQSRWIETMGCIVSTYTKKTSAIILLRVFSCTSGQTFTLLTFPINLNSKSKPNKLYSTLPKNATI